MGEPKPPSKKNAHKKTSGGEQGGSRLCHRGMEMGKKEENGYQNVTIFIPPLFSVELSSVFLFLLINCWSSVVCLGCVVNSCAISTVLSSPPLTA